MLAIEDAITSTNYYVLTDHLNSVRDVIDTQGNVAFHQTYDASLGKWISEDPFGFEAGDTNLTRYVGNQVLTSTDPSGWAMWVDSFALLGYNPSPVDFLRTKYWIRDELLAWARAKCPLRKHWDYRPKQ